ncbi:MAG: DedA family protein [Patescibacteria group bacterium]
MDGLNLGFTSIQLEDIGYLAIFAIMTLDGANVPFTPNELFLGFTGYLARTGEVNAVLAYAVGLLGSLAGHLVSFFVGWKVGRPLFDRYGKFILVSKKSLKNGERAIKRFGPAAPFIIRFIPGLRNIGSLFLGVFRYAPGPFFLLTATGIAIYNGLFFLSGFILAERFASLKEYVFPVVVGILAVGLSLAAINWYRTRRSQVSPPKKKKRTRI